MYKIHRLIPIVVLLFVVVIVTQFMYRRSQEPKKILTKAELQVIEDGRETKEKVDVILPIVGLTLLAIGVGGFVIYKRKTRN